MELHIPVEYAFMENPQMIKNTLPKAFIILIHTVPLNVVVLNSIENTINTDAMIPII